MVDFGGRTDGKNYFVAGFRNKAGERPQRFYVINDRLYYPGKNQDSIGILKQSKRNFVTIQDNKIIVQRIKNGKIMRDPETMKSGEIGSEFILEICEIDL